MKKIGDERSGIDQLTFHELLQQVPSANFHHSHLESELEHREPQNDLNNIEDGKFLEALDDLPPNLRMMYASTDMHVEVEETESGYHQILKIVKKREAAFTRGKETFWGITADGTRCPLSEEEWDRLVRNKQNPNDVYNRDDVEFVQAEQDYNAPMDPWDVVFDATQFNQYLKSLRQRKKELDDALDLLDLPSEDWFKSEILRKEIQVAGKIPSASWLKDRIRYRIMKWKAEVSLIPDKHDEENQLVPGTMSDMIYSADWFPYPPDKRVHNTRAREIIQKINTSDLTKRQVGQMIGRTVDKRPQIAKELRMRANRLPRGKEKGRLLIKAQQMEREASAAKMKRRANLDKSDVRKIWEAWQRRYAELHGDVPAPVWQYRRTLSAKLKKKVLAGEMSQEEAKTYLQQKMAELYGERKPVEFELPDDMEHNPPDWLTTAEDKEEYKPVNEEDVAAIPFLLDDSEFRPVEEMNDEFPFED